MENKKWLKFNFNSAEGEATVKNVVSSGLSAALKAGAETKTLTRFSLDVGGIWKGTFKTAKKVYDTVEIPEAACISAAGAPAIPQEGVYIAIPSGATNISVKVVDKNVVDIEGIVELHPAPKPLTEAEYIKGMEEYKEDPAIYGADAAYPGKDFDYIGTKVIEGVTVAHVLVYLAQYTPKSSRLSVTKSITLEVRYTAAGGVTPIRDISGFMERSILDIKNVPIAKENLSEAIIFSPAKIVSSLSRGASLNLSSTVLKKSFIASEYVIIVTDDLESSVMPLLNAKSGWPHYAMTAVTSQITKEFPAASLKESIKAFLAWAWNNWTCPPRFVVLAGDTDKIPVHLWSINGETYASDHYYADINGSLAPEIVVSRLPASNPTQLTQICQDLANYHNKRGADWGGWQNKVLLVSYEDAEYKNCSNDISTRISPRFAVTKKYGDSSTKQQVKDEANAGALILNYRGHGAKTNWSSSNGLNTNDVSALNNQNMPPLVFCVCCQNGWIDDNSITTMAETFIRGGKSVGVIAATRNSPTYANSDFDRYLFQAIINEGNVTPGNIFNRAKSLMVMNHPNSVSHQQVVVMYMLFGDPTARVASNAEFLRGSWNMDHDGWKGTLVIDRIWNSRVEFSGGYGYPVWDISGKYTGNSDGIQYTFTGKFGGNDPNDKNAGSKRSDHKIIFNIGFPGNTQKFEGYVITWGCNSMSGYTWWSGHPYGWYCQKK